jgi:transcriptional regulator of acetoin/glycerol metabolism
VRELENMVERSVILSKKKTISLSEVPEDILVQPAKKGKRIEDVTRNHILHILKETKGNISEAAKVLGIQRMTLYNKLKKFNVSVDKLDT